MRMISRKPRPGARPITIQALHAGGGTIALAPLPGIGGDYAGDLEHIKGWKPAFVVTLVTHVELVEAGIPDLGPDIQDKGARWIHLPVADFGTPNASFVLRWPDLSAQALKALSGGGKVLVHCKGGCGRSGMVALRLMIEAGEAPDEALERLRAVRPCAVETAEQLRWACAAERAPAQFFRHRD